VEPLQSGYIDWFFPFLLSFLKYKEMTVNIQLAYEATFIT
jgi:hypothetical protein